MNTRLFFFLLPKAAFTHALERLHICLFSPSASCARSYVHRCMEHCCRGVPAVFTHEARLRTSGVKIQSKNGDICMKNRILISCSARVKGAWLTLAVGVFWADLHVVTEVYEPQNVTHISFFLLSLFFFKATVCVLVYAGKVLLLWKLTVINWSFQVRRMRKTQKYVEMTSACFPSEPKLRSAALRSGCDIRKANTNLNL